MDWLDAIEARAQAATAGPWGITGAWGQLINSKPGVIAEIWRGRNAFSRPEKEGHANREFIAHSREDVPRLVAEVRTLRVDLARVTAERDAAKNVIRDICDHCGWNAHSPTCRGIDCPIEPWLSATPPQNYIGKEAVAGPEEVQDAQDD